MEKRTWKEYRAFIRSKTTGEYVYCYRVSGRTLEECKADFELKKRKDGPFMYRDCDWNDVKYECKEYTCINWGFVDG